MKRFIGLVLCGTLLFIGVGGLIEQAGARFKSDEKALALLQRARLAIGGESAVSNVRSMTIVGKSTKTFGPDGAREEIGDVEINFELPNKLSKTMKFGTDDGSNAVVDRNVDVFVVKKGDNVQWRTEGGDDVKADAVKRVIIRKNDGSEEVVTEDVKPVIIRKTDGSGGVWTTNDDKTIEIRKGGVTMPEASGNHLELFRMTLSLLLSTPAGADVSYTYAGEGNVDGVPVEIIDATIGNGGVKLFLDKSTSLPRMMTYKGFKPVIAIFNKSEDGKNESSAEIKIFERRMEGPEMTDIQVKYSDFRSVGGILLPFKWTQTAGGKADETVDITSYEINPANISDKFKEMPTKVRVTVNKDK